MLRSLRSATLLARSAESPTRLPSRLPHPPPAAYRPFANSTRFSSTQSTPAEDATAKAESQASDKEAEKGAENEQSTELKALKDELEAKNHKLAELKDAGLRARADFENLQKTTAARNKDAKDLAIRKFAKDLVADLDVLELALQSVKEDQREGLVKELWDGVNGTSNMLKKTLERNGVVAFDPEGEKFDPNKHEAVFQAPIPGKEADTVVVQKIGWMLNNRVLRPAQVGVVLPKP